MHAIRSIVLKNMTQIALVMVILILLVSSVLQIFGVQRSAQREARRIFVQVEQILEENSQELEHIQKEYEATCLNDARTVAYILKHNPAAIDSPEELQKIAANVEVNEIHIFDASGTIISGTHPEYYGMTFDSGDQIEFFKPLLKDKRLELVQEVTPNTAEGRMSQYSALWSEDGRFIIQVGMDPATVLRVTEQNELSYIFSLLRTGVNYSLYAIAPAGDTVAGSTISADVGRDITEIGFQEEQLESGELFVAAPDGVKSFCLSQKIGSNYVVWTTPRSVIYGSVLRSELVLLAGLLLIAAILVYTVTGGMNRTVILPIKKINQKLRAIQDGDLHTQVDVQDSREFTELGDHINAMVSSLLQKSEKLELTKKVQEQNRILEEQQVQLEEAVARSEAANKAKSEFLFNMSHDIRTPMNAIMGFTDLALKSGDLYTQRDYLQKIDISAKQLLDIINNILELSRIENHRITIDAVTVDAEETYRNLCTVFDSDVKQKNLHCTTDIDIQHPYLCIDTTHYAQILLNVVNNAIKYTPVAGRVDITFRELPGENEDSVIVETVVSDSGIGMSPEFLEHAFDSFSRERTSTISGIQGTGLGLAIVKNLVDLMGGTIAIESNPGEGTTVTIRLPHKIGTAPVDEAAELLETMDNSLFQGKRVLLAEDIDINAIITTKLLTSKGFLVDRARDGVECVAMLLKAEPGYYDLVLMDIQMPNMDGYRAAQSIRTFWDEEKASIPILALTANAFKEDFDKAVEAGMDGHIAKPLDAAKLFQSIAEVLYPQVKK